MARYAKFFSVGGGGGLTNFIDGVCNATQATAFIEVIGTAADINFALKPKGTGAIIAACPDATAIGGNARGQYAVDLQIIRATATQVASGDYSAILGGRNNSTNNLADTFIMGSSITANTACTSYVNNLNIFNTPTVDISVDAVLVRDPVTGLIKSRSAASLAQEVIVQGSCTSSSY